MRRAPGTSLRPQAAALAAACALGCGPSELPDGRTLLQEAKRLLSEVRAEHAPPPPGAEPASRDAAAPAASGTPAPAPAEPPAPEAGETRSYWSFVDDNGSVRIVDSRSAVPRHKRGGAREIVIDAGPVRYADADAGAPAAGRAFRQAAERTGVAARPAPDVVIYTARWCGWCRKALRHLDARGVDYRNRDIEDEPGAMRDLRRLTGSGSVPVLEIDGQVVRGFDVARIDALLAGGR